MEKAPKGPGETLPQGRGGGFASSSYSMLFLFLVPVHMAAGRRTGFLSPPWSLNPQPPTPRTLEQGWWRGPRAQQAWEDLKRFFLGVLLLFVYLF